MGLLKKKKNKPDKEPFKDRPIGKVAGKALNIIGDVAKIPSIKNWFTGEKKIAGMTWKQLAVLIGGILIFSTLIKFEIIDIDTVVMLIEKMMGG